MSVLKAIDRQLNNYTMYRVVLYGLFALAGVALVIAGMGKLPFTTWQLTLLLALCLTTSFVAHQLVGRLFRSVSNLESGTISSLIFFFILAPVRDLHDVAVSVGTIFFAVFSKYLLAVDKKHIFNPVAIGLVVAGLFGYGNAIWWVGSSVLLPFVLLLALAVVRKLRRFDVFSAFIITSLVTVSWLNRNSMSWLETVFQVIGSWPLVFFAGIMLTEPLTGPVSKRLYGYYGALVGVLFASRFQFGPLHSTPELALVLGNLLVYLLTKQVKLELKLKGRRSIGQDIYAFDFVPRGSFAFRPGQYLEWTLPQQGSDQRGNRRYFTIASSPTESVVSLAVKVAHPSSSFKQQLMAMQKGKKIIASQLSGDFVLPKDTRQSLVWIAGGIGITPFRSQAKYLLDSKQKRDITLFYICSEENEFAYRELWKEVEAIGIKTVLVLTNRVLARNNWLGEFGYLDEALLRRYLPTLHDRRYYLSGPNVMVEAYQDLLRGLRVPKRRIITDYFPGF